MKSPPFSLSIVILVGTTIGMNASYGIAASKRCRSDADCRLNDTCIQPNLENPNAKRYCTEPNNQKSLIWLRRQQAETKGAPVYKAWVGATTSRIMLYSGLAITGGFGLAALIDVAGNSFSGDDDYNATPYVVGLTAGLGVVTVAPIVSNISSQLRHNAYKAEGYRPSASVAAASWTLGSASIGLYGAGIALYFSNPDAYPWGWGLVGLSMVCSIVVDQLRLRWNRQLIFSVSRETTRKGDWYPGFGIAANPATGDLVPTLGVSGAF